MKHTKFLTIPLFVFIGTTCADATNIHMYSNAISAHNIFAIQHDISTSVFSGFGGSMGSVIYGNKKSALPAPGEDPNATYGQAPIYGTAPLYGEYNDDGTAGRSGGNYYNADAALNNIWLKWQHIGDTADFDNISRIDSDTDIVMLGIAGGQSEFAGGLSKWGMYTGYAGGTQKNSEISIDEHGGFVGFYNGNTFGNLGLYATVNGGVIDNSADNAFGTDEYTNFWVGGAINASYNIALDDTFVIQPALHAGYTWIKSENYTSASGDILRNDAFSMFELSPTVRAIKHIGNGWVGSANVKYVMHFANGGDISANTIDLDALSDGNFTEYSLSLEKSVADINVSANFGRRDGVRYGWFGGLNIKYLF